MVVLCWVPLVTRGAPGLLQKPNTELGLSAKLPQIPQQRSKMPEMSERLMEVFAVIVTIIVGAGLSEMFIHFLER